MCGIAGAYHFGGPPVDPSVVTRMIDRLTHRGPDDSGSRIVDHVGLGNRRLKILDLSSAGHQPMTTDDGRLSVTFNGEIYNYVELKDELVRRGHRFRSHTDTEVVLHSFAEWGTGCFARFNGMWAIAMYDARDRTLVLSRDRWGVKPLYVHRSPGRLVFGSEVKALLEHPDVPRRPNLRTIYNYVARHYRWVDGGADSFFDTIEHFPPAHYWTITAAGDVIATRYWDLDPARRFPSDADEDVLAEFRRLFTDAVRVRLRSDVPVASMLSGGLDSSSVTCVAAQLSSTPVTTFSARYAEQEFDEGPYIEETIRHVNADGRIVWPVAGDLLETLDTMLRFHDEPVCTVTFFAHWMVMREVAKLGFPVLLNGHVGDELFAGYWEHYRYNFVDLERDGSPRFQSEYDQWMANHHRDPQEYPRFRAELAATERGAITKADRFTHYAGVVHDAIRSSFSTLPPRPNPFAGRGYLDAELYDELIYETVPATLRPEDRNSMAFSIETRSPFLDYRLAEFAFSLSSKHKIRDGLGKWTIREGMKGILPELVRARRDKQGFNAPTVHWFRGETGRMVRDILASGSARQRGILKTDQVLRCFDEHAAGAANHYMAIWQWLNLELWMRQSFDRVSDAQLTAHVPRA